jgi:hypothetical protein
VLGESTCDHSQGWRSFSRKRLLDDLILGLSPITLSAQLLDCSKALPFIPSNRCGITIHHIDNAASSPVVQLKRTGTIQESSSSPDRFRAVFMSVCRWPATCPWNTQLIFHHDSLEYERNLIINVPNPFSVFTDPSVHKLAALFI